jgi:hypothetical protein
MKTIAQAEAEGYTIDHSASGRPWAYKGPRFNCTSSFPVLTELEVELLAALRQIAESCPTSEEGETLVSVARAAIAKATGGGQ